jgi:hypothetical protein
MDVQQAPEDAKRERRQMLIGITITTIVLLLIVAFFTLMLMRTGGKGNYYQDIMDSQKLRQESTN